MAAARQIRMTVNGASHEAWVEPRTTLADFLLALGAADRFLGAGRDDESRPDPRATAPS